MRGREQPKSPARAFIKHDRATVGSGPSMLSASEKPYAVGELVYVVALDEAYTRSRRNGGELQDSYKPTIQAHRVIQVNFQYRTVRLRCAKGCEDVLRFNDGGRCSTVKYWHTLIEARAELSDKIDDQMKATAVERAKYERQLKDMKAAQLALSRLKPEKLPAEVV